MFVHTLLDKYLQQRAKKYLFHQIFQLNFQLHFKQPAGVMRAFGKHVIYTHKPRLIILYHTSIWGYGNLAISKSEKCIDSYIGGYAGRQVYNYFNGTGCIIFDLFDLDLTFFIGSHYA